MEHYFELPIAYDGAQHRFRARLTTFGYNYTFYVIVDGKEWTFEKDEAQNIQLTYPKLSSNPVITEGLLSKIMEELNRHVTG